MPKIPIIPHFVADRPMSLRILSGLDFDTHSVTVGLMVQACSSRKFRDMVAKFPCIDPDYCGVIHGKCPYDGTLERCQAGLKVKSCFTTIADSGVFTKNGATINYHELFNRYESMKVDRGIIFDVLGDPEKTIESAQVGFDTYSEKKCSFKLIGVAQGNSPDEYVHCYEQLLEIGYAEIAIGGLLTKKINTARYAHSNKGDIEAVVKRIRSEWPDDRCFTLGVYNPKRHGFLSSLGVNAADYKGWIFQYKKRYQDPYCHHIDRLLQTQSFIETNILSRMSGNDPKEKSIDIISGGIKDNTILVGRRILSKSSVGKSDENIVESYTSPKKIVIISCGKRKNEQQQCPASEAYVGQSFKLKRIYAEQQKCPWLILSAKYGLLRPETPINPHYDKTINNEREVRELSNTIISQINSYLELTIADEIEFLGPTSYAKALRHGLANFNHLKIVHLTEGLPQGKAMRKIKDRINTTELPSSTPVQIRE